MSATWQEVRAEAEFRRYAEASGQVLCADNPDLNLHEFWITRGYACPVCKAAL